MSIHVLIAIYTATHSKHTSKEYSSTVVYDLSSPMIVTTKN